MARNKNKLRPFCYDGPGPCSTTATARAFYQQPWITSTGLSPEAVLEGGGISLKADREALPFDQASFAIFSEASISALR